MAACTRCGAKLHDNVRFCTQCGADQEARFSEAVTVVTPRGAPRPPDVTSDAATVPVVRPPADAFDPLAEFAGPSAEGPDSGTDFYRPPPPRESQAPTRDYAIPAQPPAPLIEPSFAEPSAATVVYPPPFPPPPIAPLPESAPAARQSARPGLPPQIVFPPRSDEHMLSASSRNLLFMGMLVWGVAALGYAGYLTWSIWSPATDTVPDATATTLPSQTAAPGEATAVAASPGAPGVGNGQSVFTGHSAAVTSVAVSSAQRVLSGGGQGDCSVRIWDLSQASQSGRFDGHGQDCAVLFVGFVGTGSTAVSAAGPADFALRVWDPQHGGEVRQLSGGEGLVFRAVAPDGTRAIAQEPGLDGGGFSLWNLETGARVSAVPAPGLASAFAFAPAGDLILTGGDSGRIAVWDAATGSQLKAFPGHGPGVTVSAVAFAPNRRLLVSVGTDQRVVLWDPETGASFRAIADATTFAMADDSRTIAVAGPDGLVRVLDSITGTEQARFAGHAGAVQALAWAPGGRTLVSGGSDKTVRVWSVTPRP